MVITWFINKNHSNGPRLHEMRGLCSLSWPWLWLRWSQVTAVKWPNCWTLRTLWYIIGGHKIIATGFQIPVHQTWRCTLYCMHPVHFLHSLTFSSNCTNRRLLMHIQKERRLCKMNGLLWDKLETDLVIRSCQIVSDPVKSCHETNKEL